MKVLAYRNNSVVEDFFALLQTLLDFGFLVRNVLLLDCSDDNLLEAKFKDKPQQRTDHSGENNIPQIVQISDWHVTLDSKSAKINHRFDKSVDHQISD